MAEEELTTATPKEKNERHYEALKAEYDYITGKIASLEGKLKDDAESQVEDIKAEIVRFEGILGIKTSHLAVKAAK